MEDSVNTRILKRLGYFIAEIEDRDMWGDTAVQLCGPDGEGYEWTAVEWIEYGDVEQWLFLHMPQVEPFPLLEGLRWSAECHPDRLLGKIYQVVINERDTGFGEADTLEEAVCVAWLNYMERKDRREQKT